MTVSAALAGLDDLIGAIYDCVIDPARWHDTLEAICRRHGFFNAVLGVNSTVTNEMVLSVAVNVPPEMAAIAQTHSRYVVDLWGGLARVSSVPLEEPVINSEVTDRRSWPANPYFAHFIEPQGLNDAVAIVLARDAYTIANVAFGRHVSAPPLTQDHLNELRILGPHLRRAIVIGRLLDTSMRATKSFAEVIDASRAGVVLVDAKRRVVHANRVAAAMLSANDPISDMNGQLDLLGEIVPGSFQRAVEGASEAKPGGKGAGVPARSNNGRPLTAQVLPLEQLHGSVTPGEAIAAVFVSDAPGGPATSGEILSALFDLTPAEARIFSLVVEGRELAEIGTQLSISPATAKTHLAHIYAKTGRNSRADLVRLAHELAPPV